MKETFTTPFQQLEQQQFRSNRSNNCDEQIKVLQGKNRQKYGLFDHDISYRGTHFK